jgi:gliding motility-associated-like protein
LTDYGYIGNFVIDKLASKVYMGQGYAPTAGTQIIRLDSNGVYDNFISTTNVNFNEIWEMNFDCNSGNVLGMGGGTSDNINMGVINSAGGFSSSNITGLPGGLQDILSSTITSNGELIVAMASNSTPSLNNTIIKVNATLNGNVWIAPLGFGSFAEADNKPFIGMEVSNGYNALHSNKNYLFYYDGLRVAAFSNATGASVGGAYTIPGGVLKMQGGIYADDCDNIYVGGDNGNIKVFHFDGTTFTTLPDINITGMAGKHVFDIKYNGNNHLLYVSGDQFVATVDRSQVCNDSLSFNIALVSDCIEAIVNITNGGAMNQYSYFWTDNTTNTPVRTTLNVTQLSDTLPSLIQGHTYTVLVIMNAVCGGPSAQRTFTVDDAPDTASQTISICKGGVFSFNNHNYTEAGVYIDSVKKTSGCYRIMITTIKVTQNEENVFFVPSAFSPNHDNVNDCFGVGFWKGIQQFEFRIYNRFGEELFSTYNLQDCWDGHYKGELVDLGVYFYYIKAVTSCGEHVVKGDVTVIN